MPTIREVAEKAKVSVASVSNALNGSGRLGAATKKKILKVARSMDYSPSLCARAMNGHRLKAMGIFVDGIAGPIYGETIEGAQEALKAEGWGLIVGTLNDPARELATVLARESWLAGSIILNGGLAPTGMIESMAAKAPLIVMDIDPGVLSLAPKRGRLVRVRIDNEGGMSLALAQAFDQGVRELLFLGGDPRSFDARERSDAASRSVLGRDLKSVEFRVCGFKALAAYETVKRLLASGASFDGLVAANDEMALGAMRALREEGLSAPDDVVVIGFDDIEAAQWSNPALSTVRVERRKLGELLARTLLEMEGSERPRAETISFPVEFMPRASSARKGGGR